MKNSLLLAAAFGLVAIAMPVAPVSAQTGGLEETKANTRAAKRAQAAAKTGTKATPLFPQATREEPKPQGTRELSKQLTELFDLQEKDGDPDTMIAKADAILANPKANAFDRSTAAYIAANAWLAKDTDNYTEASKYYERVISENGLSNNTHYQVMLQLGQMLSSDERYPEAQAMVNRFETETKSEDPKAYNLKAMIALGMDKPEEAAAMLEKVLATKPDDKKTLLNLASIYQQAGNDAKTLEVFNRLRSGGMMTESRDYEAAWRLMANIDGKEAEALALIDEGMAKGILEPSYEAYVFQGRAHYDADQIDKAIEAWSKAAPMGKDGETYLNVAKLQAEAERWAPAKASARSALDKGVKKPGDAWQVIARSEEGLGNKPAMLAALRETAKFPETRKWADAELRRASGK